ncbi:MAG: sensor histidine kinase, partial [Parcubacteria group bacterium CG23_combo_of_CG06-09_8_20_14_all_35_6]
FLIKSVVNEVDYRKKLESAYEELKVLDHAKSEFVSIASHQLRTPLTAIKGYISMILEGSYGSLQEKTKESLTKVYQANERLIKLVNDLLDLSRLESGKIEIQKKKTSLDVMVTNVVEMLKIQAQNKNLYLKMKKPRELIPQLDIDEQKISQAVLNIIDNAIRYTENGGIVIEVSLEKEEKKIVIEIKDTGLGMDKKDIQDLFESFSRGKVATKHWTEGAGLGLYIAKKFVEMHNGKIWAESDGIDKGSSFFIELPIN